MKIHIGISEYATDCLHQSDVISLNESVYHTVVYVIYYIRK